MPGPEHFREPFTGTIADANYLPEQPPAAETVTPAVTVDPGAQAIVWALTASTHAAEALDALTELERLREGQQADPDQMGLLIRRAEYHTKSHAIADKTAGMWALIMTTAYEDQGTSGDQGKSGDMGKTDGTPA